MKFHFELTHLLKIITLAICLSFSPGWPSVSRAAQNVPEPRREQILNGLNILLWSRRSDPNVLLKMRVHSGAAFDMAGKMGTAALLSDLLFPDPTTREFFTEELGGRLEVTSDYDAINITMEGRASEFERMIEVLRAALINTPLTAETIATQRDARIKLVRDLSIAPGTIADRAIAARLFGDYPYGRPASGSVESLARVDRADLLFARERFLNPNNATLAIVGGVDDRRAMRTLRQLLGSWRKSDTIVPATFRQPGAADTRTLLIDQPGAETAEVRLAARGLARSDRDYAAAVLLAPLARDRWQAALPELKRAASFVRHEAHVLPGSFLLGASVPANLAPNALATARSVVSSLAASPPTGVELERVRSEVIALMNKQTEQQGSLADLWLDVETFKLDSTDEQMRALARVTIADLQRVAAKLFTNAPAASVVLGNAAQLRTDLERAGKVELFGTSDAPTASPAKKQ